MTHSSDLQLAAIDRVHALFSPARLEYWLFGGWAVDFHAGTVTREHGDVDIAVWLADLPRISELLIGDGWRHAPTEDEDGGTGYERDGVRLELTYLVRDGGLVFTPLREGRATWAEGAFADDVRELLGVRGRVVSLAPLMRSKASARDDTEEAAKDAADHATLSRISRPG